MTWNYLPTIHFPWTSDAVLLFAWLSLFHFLALYSARNTGLPRLNIIEVWGRECFNSGTRRESKQHVYISNIKTRTDNTLFSLPEQLRDIVWGVGRGAANVTIQVRETCRDARQCSKWYRQKKTGLLLDKHICSQIHIIEPKEISKWHWKKHTKITTKNNKKTTTKVKKFNSPQLESFCFPQRWGSCRPKRSRECLHLFSGIWEGFWHRTNFAPVRMAFTGDVRGKIKDSAIPRPNIGTVDTFNWNITWIKPLQISSWLAYPPSAFLVLCPNVQIIIFQGWIKSSIYHFCAMSMQIWPTMHKPKSMCRIIV